MPPAGAPATSFSARMQAVTSGCAARRRACAGGLHDGSGTAHSRAAELDSPAPTAPGCPRARPAGEVPAVLRQRPQHPAGVRRPAGRRPGRRSGARELSALVLRSVKGRPRAGPLAAYVACGRAIGRQRPPL